MDKYEIKEIGMVLDSKDFGETDRLVTIFFPKVGKIICKMRGVKKPKAKLAYASFPFNLGEYIVVKRGKSYTVINCNYVDNFAALSYNLNSYYAASAVLETINKLLREGESDNEALFLILVKTIKQLCYGKEQDILLVLTKFIYDVLAYSGFKIVADELLDTNKVYFNYYLGVLTSIMPEQGVELSIAEAECLNAVINYSCDELLNTEIKASKNILKLLVLFFEERVDEELKILKKFI